MTELLGVAEAKRRFSELVDRVGAGERIVIARRGRPVVALTPPNDDDPTGGRVGAPTGYAATAGALEDLEGFEETMAEVEALRGEARDRLPPVLD